MKKYAYGPHLSNIALAAAAVPLLNLNDTVPGMELDDSMNVDVIGERLHRRRHSSRRHHTRRSDRHGPVPYEPRRGPVRVVEEDEDDDDEEDSAFGFGTIMGVAGVSMGLYVLYQHLKESPTSATDKLHKDEALLAERRKNLSWEGDTEYRGETKDYDENDVDRLQRARLARTEFTSITRSTFSRMTQPLMFAGLGLAMRYSRQIWSGVKDLMNSDFLDEEEVEEVVDVKPQKFQAGQHGICEFEERRLALLNGVDLDSAIDADIDIEEDIIIEDDVPRAKLPKIRIGSGPTAKMMIEYVPTLAQFIATQYDQPAPRGKVKLGKEAMKELASAKQTTEDLLKARNEMFDQLNREQSLTYGADNADGDWSVLAGQAGFGSGEEKKKTKFPIAQALGLLPVAAEMYDRLV